MAQHELKWTRRTRRALAVRKGLRGQTDRPRLSVFRSLKHISAQIIDDAKGRTIAAASTEEKSLAGLAKSGEKKATKSQMSRIVGEAIAKRAIEKNIHKVVFDRGSFRYHGRIKALADAARKAGLQF
ncbi:MAG: 50S ribosomal protein L18 [Planctomycetes bacterium]|nr:50S ribosomal protein L18 [Planctomycetota bacterium]